MAAWLIIGISGVTCGGKTTLSQTLHKYLSDQKNRHCLSDRVRIGIVKIMNQDDYFYPANYPQHEWIEHLNHVNYDVINAINMTKMCNDLHTELDKRFIFYSKNTNMDLTILNIMIIDGFLIFNHSIMNRLCQLKFHIHLPYEKCYERRLKRTYNPPDCLGYFELCVWPMYERNFEQIRAKDDIILLNGDTSKEKIFKHVFDCIHKII